MLIKSRQLVKASQKLKAHKASKNTQLKVLKTTDGDVFVCKQGDMVCWQRYTSAMTDCV
ncbi:hypothetical protein [Candidatus Methylopumilus planktonicus]|uniref:hypothetical protein n=1 Tax=Candidatus Methylopumilus planktonicus TaxID=1581557 RepID=UPI0012E0BEAB|nr:hypothetical protein [Candidatus Methylopumilus planktonicus]